jgi:UDP-3-O-[3-hydroxymyristoyl] glucosamine N-acyltransferase
MIHSTAIFNNITLGKNVSIGPYTVIEEGTVIEDNVSIQGHVRIGKDCLIEEGCTIKWGAILTEKVNLGKNVFFGTQSVTLGSDVDGTSHGTIIGDNCYIGAKVTIFPSVSIVDGCIIGACAMIRMPIMAKGTYINKGELIE